MADEEEESVEAQGMESFSDGEVEPIVKVL